MESQYRRRRILAPTQSLPLLAQLASVSTLLVKNALDNLRILYFPHTPSTSAIISDELSLETSIALNSAPLQPKATVHRPRVDEIPDSGYASAEEDDDISVPKDDAKEDALSTLRSDPFERAYAFKWLTGFVSRSDAWLSSCSLDEDVDGTLRAELLEEAVRLINAFSDDTPSPDTDSEEDGSIIRSFSFSIPLLRHSPEVVIQLNDAPLSNSDHTSVGLQSWGSSIILAERICSNPFSFSVLKRCDGAAHPDVPLRVLELGAGTGLLSITISKLVQLHSSAAEIVATDYHPDVLVNLSSNIATNFQLPSSGSKPDPDVTPHPMTMSAHAFDWEHPDYSSAPFTGAFDVILAADVVYHPLHTIWIKSCVEHLLLKPKLGNNNGGVFWLIIPVRTTGRHEMMHATVEEVFGTAGPDKNGTTDDVITLRLGILEKEEILKRGGVGRADESGYMLYKIGWVTQAVT